MFPDQDTKEAPAKKKSLPRSKMVLVGGSLLAVCLLALAVTAYTQYKAEESRIITPRIAARVKFPIYVPQELPGAYKPAKETVTLTENDTILLFRAKDGVGGDLIFSEQARSKKFNFGEFYKAQFTDAKTLSKVPYPSVWGTTTDGRRGLSVVASDTWIFMVTSAPLDGADMALIAAGLQK
jgi:hypothetical protein